MADYEQDDSRRHQHPGGEADVVPLPEASGQPPSEVAAPALPVPTAEGSPQLVIVHGKGRRKDRGRLHALRHGVLARHPMEALRRLGEDVKRLRRLERQFRAELRPHGAIAELIFDRYWASYLRCLLAARVEANAFLASVPDAAESAASSKLVDGDPPTLVVDERVSSLHQVLSPDVLRQLTLVQRYDTRYAGEMYKALGLLILMRSNGEAGLEEAISAILGIGKGGSPLQ